MKVFNLLSLALLSLGVAHADEVNPNWVLGGDLYLGTIIPDGTGASAGVAMGGKAGARYDSPARHVMIFGELTGEGFNNKSDSKDIQFSQFYLNAGLMVGNRSVKWKTPVNIALSRDINSNEDITVRYAFSGLYIKMLDDTQGEGELHQVLETMADFVVEHITYLTGWQMAYEPCRPDQPCNSPVQTTSSDRTILGLYAALKYEIEKRGWGSSMSVELVQDLSPSYTKLGGKIVGFKQLSGDLKNLRPYIEVNGTLDHDALDPSGSLQGAVRIFGGISGRFGF